MEIRGKLRMLELVHTGLGKAKCAVGTPEGPLELLVPSGVLELRWDINHWSANSW